MKLLGRTGTSSTLYHYGPSKKDFGKKEASSSSTLLARMLRPELNLAASQWSYFQPRSFVGQRRSMTLSLGLSIGAHVKHPWLLLSSGPPNYRRGRPDGSLFMSIVIIRDLQQQTHAK